jgi:hypothetical protein
MVCAYPPEFVLLFLLIPLITVVIAALLIWYYALRSAESVAEKIINIGVALLLDAFILSTAISLFYTLSGCGP